MYKLNFFVPTANKEEVKSALFDMGVGRYDNYDYCSFETLGTGQFRPIDNAKPHIGSLGEIESVQEYKVEMICAKELIKEAIEVLKAIHPYEEVAYEVFKMETF
ncbi:MAG: NGG1p interacting factor NIF3 [Campylobacterota bacterium]|nr:NGG1p interacting factor NIF3 [Campylobacterota bacterium]